MKELFILLFAITIAFLPSLNGQSYLTPYDQVPGMVTAEKPYPHTNRNQVYDIIYQYPVTVTDMEKTLTNTVHDEKNAFKRYIKMWLKHVPEFLETNGTVDLRAVQNFRSALYSGQQKLDTQEESAPSWDFIGPVETFWLNSSNSPEPPLPCPWQVNVYSFDVDNNDHNRIVVGTETGFVNMSTDAGLNWNQLGRDYHFGGGIADVIIHPTQPNLFFIAAGNQIHISENSGQTWRPLFTGSNGTQIRNMEIVADRPNRITCATSNGIWITEDMGAWQQRSTTPSWDIHTSYSDPDIMYAIGDNNGFFEFMVSENGGQSFSSDADFPNDIAQVSGGLISLTPAADELIRVVMLSSDRTPLIYEKKNSQATWALMAQGKTTTFPMDNGQGFFDLVLETSPVDPNLIYAGTTTLYVSRDGGKQFQAIGGYQGSFPIHPDIQDLKVLNANQVWVSTDGGMTLSQDQFQTLENAYARNNGIVGSDMWGFDQGWNEDIVIGGRYHNGNTAIKEGYGHKALRMGGAESPTGWVLDGKSRHVAFNDLGNGWVLPETAEGPPEGRFIFSKYPNMDEYGGRRGNLMAHPHYFGHLYVGEGNGLWLSTDAGQSYDLLHDFGDRIRYFEIAYSNGDVIYADVVNQGLVKSMDGGLTWTSLPSLTSGAYGNSSWRGQLHFVISPTDANHLYACRSNGTWSSDKSQIFESVDGGNTWQDITFDLDVFTKGLAIQVDENGDDIIYLTANAHRTNWSKVYFRRAYEEEWSELGEGFPSGFRFNSMMPFYRDGLVRVAGNGGIWSHQLVEMEGAPIITPWVEKAHVNCYLDTIQLDDHSMVNHEGCTWEWDINPTPLYISNRETRNPRVVLGNPGVYDVTLTLTKNGQSYRSTISEMVSASSCPSIADCNNPDFLPKDQWSLLYFDSEEVNFPGLASMAFDSDPETIWHTRWSTGTDVHPHELQLDLGQEYELHELKYLPRQVGVNGRIRDYELYISDDGMSWGSPLSTGSFLNSSAPQTVDLPDGTRSRYFRLVALNEVNDGPWTSIAELDLLGCIPNTTSTHQISTQIKAYPVPSDGQVYFPQPACPVHHWHVIDAQGKRVMQGSELGKRESLDLGNLSNGYYVILLTTDSGANYRVSVVLNK